MKIEDIEENYPDALLADGFDECIVGVTIEGQVVYDVNKMIEQMMSQDGMDQDIAQEYFYFNIAGAYLGENTPVYIYI